MTGTANSKWNAPAPESGDRAAALSDILVAYLLGTAYRLPGADGMLVSDALREYTALASARRVPDELALCARHPELAAQAVAFCFLAAAAGGLPD